MKKYYGSYAPIHYYKPPTKAKAPEAMSIGQKFKKAGEWVSKAKTNYDTGRQVYNAYQQALPVAEEAMAIGANAGRAIAPFAAMALL